MLDERFIGVSFATNWRGGGVVYRDGLENRRGCKPSGGSNPSLSAITVAHLQHRKILLFTVY